MNFKNLLSQLPGFLQNPNPDIYLSNNYVVVDFETTNVKKGSPYCKDNRIIFVSWLVHTVAGIIHKFKWANEFELQDLVIDCERSDFLVAHNAKFELGWLERCGLDISKVVVFDTMIAEYVIAGNRKWALNLEACMHRRNWRGKIAVIHKMMEVGICPSEMPQSWVQTYGIKDVLDEHKLFLDQRETLYKDGLAPVFFTRCLLTPVLVDIEKRGICLDPDRVKRVFNNHVWRLQKLKFEIDKLTGGINFNSGQQLAKFLYEDLKFKIPKDYKGNELKTDKGRPKTDEKTLALLKATNKKQARFLELYKEINRVSNTISKYLGKFNACVNETSNGIIYASLNQTITRTHRLSSTGIDYNTQFQNIQRDLKPLIKARHEGWDIGEGDQAQLEYRVAVEMGKDEAGLYDILHKVDAHCFTASIIFAEEWAECGGDKKSPLGKKVRTASKSHTFKPLYYGHSGTEREKAYYKAFQEKHKGITAMQQAWISEVLRTKKLRTISGLIYYWPDTKMTRSGYVTNSTSICNYPVQMFATADIVPIGVVYLWHFMKVMGLQSFLINTVHDSVIGEIHPEEKEVWKSLCDIALVETVLWYLKGVYKVEFKTPLAAEIEFHRNWADSEDWQKDFLYEEEVSSGPAEAVVGEMGTS